MQQPISKATDEKSSFASFDWRLYVYHISYFNRQVVIVLTQLEGSDGFSVSHRLNFRTMVDNGDGDYGAQHMPELGKDLFGLHSPRPIT